MRNSNIAMWLLAAAVLVVLGSMDQRGFVECVITDKGHFSVVLLGPPEAGKSETFGHLIYPEVLSNFDDEFKKKSKLVGNGLAAYQWVLDQIKEERGAQHVTSIATWKLESRKYFITLLDFDGTSINDVVPAVSQADYALLVVSATLEFQSGVTSMKEQSLIARKLGVNRIIVAVNQMDGTDPPYAQVRFTEVKGAVLLVLKRAGYDPDSVIFVPISAAIGDNFRQPSPNMGWYKGINLMDALEALELPNRQAGIALRLPIEDVYANEGTVAVGRIQTGILSSGDQLSCAPAGISAVAELLERSDPTTGDFVSVKLPNVAVTALERGTVCGSATEDPPAAARSFRAQITIINGKITAGYSFVLFCHTARVDAEISELIERLSATTGEKLEDRPESLRSGDVGTVNIIPSEPIVVETVEDYPALGRFLVGNGNSGEIVASGVIKAVEKIRPLI